MFQFLLFIQRKIKRDESNNMVSRLELVLKELNENGNFRASLFSTSTGLVLASQKAEDVDERVVADMGTLLSDAAISAGKEMNLSEAHVMKIFYNTDYIICRRQGLSSSIS